MGGPLAGQLALVTGAGRGIGRSVALGLAGAGARVALLGRTRPALDEALRECAKLGVRAAAVPADVTRPDRIRAAVQMIERDLGPVDLLVNNAGRIDAAEAPLWEAEPSDWWSVVETNLRGPVNLCRAVLPGMVERRAGRVVNVASGFGTRPVPAYSAYSVSKAAMMRLTDNLAEPLAPYGVKVFDVSPGAVHTDMTAEMPMFADKGPDDWTPVQHMVDVVVAIAEGRLDRLSGRFIHAGRDDVDTLLAAAERIRTDDTRTLRLLPYGPDDPLA